MVDWIGVRPVNVIVFIVYTGGVAPLFFNPVMQEMDERPAPGLLARAARKCPRDRAPRWTLNYHRTYRRPRSYWSV
jgi:hypothetical protein